MAGVDFPIGVWLLTQDLEGTIKEELHFNAQELVDLEVFNVSSRTPVLTGALLSDVQGIAYLDPNQKDLAFIFSGIENQLDEYGRIYDLYQEGGSAGYGTAQQGLGLGSNNGSGNHEMFGRILTDDIPDIETWGTAACQTALNRCLAGTGKKK